MTTATVIAIAMMTTIDHLALTPKPRNKQYSTFGADLHDNNLWVQISTYKTQKLVFTSKFMFIQTTIVANFAYMYAIVDGILRTCLDSKLQSKPLAYWQFHLCRCVVGIISVLFACEANNEKKTNSSYLHSLFILSWQISTDIFIVENLSSNFSKWGVPTFIVYHILERCDTVWFCEQKTRNKNENHPLLQKHTRLIATLKRFQLATSFNSLTFSNRRCLN